MNFIVKLDDTEYGPVDELTLAKWVEEDRITAETEMRSEMIELWSKASDMPFLENALGEQRKRMIAGGLIDPREKQESGLSKLCHAIWGRKINRPFAMGYKPGYVTLSNRFSAFCFDAAILLVAFLLICCGGLGYAVKKAKVSTDQAPLAITDNLKTRAEKAKAEAEAQAKSKPKEQEIDPDSNEALLAESARKAREARNQAMSELEAKFGEDFAKLKKGNFEATTPPTIYADRSAGYRRGYLWVNIDDNNKRYICLSADNEHALWLAADDLSDIITLAAMAWLPLMLLYYSLTLGYFAQSPGMWFFGIFICARNEEEAYFFRSFCFTLLMLVFGLLTPLCMLLFKRGLHDILSGVYVYSVVARSTDGA